MKKIMMIAALLVATLSASAQNEVGQVTLKPTVGMTLASITGNVTSPLSKKMKVGLTAGFEAEYGLAENFGITAGVLYAMEGAKIKYSEDGVSATTNLNFDYINIPILAQFYLVKGLAIKAGIQPAFNVRKKLSTDVSGTINDGVASKYVNDAINSVFPKDKVQTFNFSIPVGLSYEYECFVLDARYNIGVTKIMKDSDQGRNSTFTFTLGYKFAL